MAHHKTLISSLNICHGSLIYLAYDGSREVAGLKPHVSPAGSFGKKRTMDDLIAKQMRVTRQENAHCELVSFDRDTANAFQHYVNESLAFAVKRGGFRYGTVSDVGKVEVDFIYEPPQVGMEERLMLMRDSDEDKVVDAIAAGLVELQAESELKEWVTAVVKLEVNEEGGADVHFEAFQMSDICVRLFKKWRFVLEGGKEGEVGPKVSLMRKDVVVGGKDVREVDNDFFLVVVKIFDHQ
ncbi:hypothetical protein Ancab_021964, partial [Ancistrocladus abbreviatus]